MNYGGGITSRQVSLMHDGTWGVFYLDIVTGTFEVEGHARIEANLMDAYMRIRRHGDAKVTTESQKIALWVEYRNILRERGRPI